jgi:hypothetical protein
MNMIMTTTMTTNMIMTTTTITTMIIMIIALTPNQASKKEQSIMMLTKISMTLRVLLSHHTMLPSRLNSSRNTKTFLKDS